MPEGNGWYYGDVVEVVKLMDTSRFATTDPPPAIGDIGLIASINTNNGVVTYVGVEFEHRSWVMPVDHLYHP